jgi:hypothetical protein
VKAWQIIVLLIAGLNLCERHAKFLKYQQETSVENVLIFRNGRVGVNSFFIAAYENQKEQKMVY